MKNTAFKIRSFCVGANHEIVLPNGKTVLIDPYFAGFENRETVRDSVKCADLIILTHSHYDHDSDLGYFVKKCNAKVFCGALSCESLMKFHNIPFDNIFPVFPESKFTMDDLTLQFFQTKHNECGGMTFKTQKSSGVFGVPGHEQADMWGSLESLDFMLTTKNGFRLMMVSGQDIFHDVFDRCNLFRPNVLLRQAGIRHAERPGEQVSAQEMAELLAKYGAEVIFPFHMDVLVKKWGEEKTAAYMQEVSDCLSKIDPGSTFIYPEALRFYNIGIDVTIE